MQEVFEEAPEQRECSTQKDFEVVAKPKVSATAIQTEEKATKAAVHEVSLQTETAQLADFGTSPLKQENPKKKAPLPLVVGSAGLSKDEAASTISRYYKKKVMRQREQAYTTSDQGILYTRKRKFNQLLGAIEIMSMYVVYDASNNRCTCLRFTIFNYATKQFSYFGVYEKLDHLNTFDVRVLLELARPSLDLIEFERSPFRHHILCMQSVI